MSLLKVNTVQTDKLQSVAGVNRNSVLQVVSKEVTTTFTSTSESFVDATDMFLAITPTSATSKILVMFNFPFLTIRTSAVSIAAFRLLRDASVVFDPTLSNSVGKYVVGISANGVTNTSFRSYQILQFLDVPSTTNEITYKMQTALYDNANSGSLSINEAGATSGISISVITLMEIAQ